MKNMGPQLRRPLLPGEQMNSSVAVMELILHASGVGGGMAGSKISAALRAIKAEAWDEGRNAFRTETNPYEEGA